MKKKRDVTNRAVPTMRVLKPKPVPAFKVLDQGMVDGEQWYTVGMTKTTSAWFRDAFKNQENKLWQDHIDTKGYINFNQKDIHEKLFNLLVLRWS